MSGWRLAAMIAVLVVFFAYQVALVARIGSKRVTDRQAAVQWAAGAVAGLGAATLIWQL